MARAPAAKYRVTNKGMQPRASLIDPAFLAERIQSALAPAVAEQKRMFGGITFLINGNMLCCASKSGLMVRVGAAANGEALASPFARPCLGAGRQMPGFIMVEPAGIESERDLRAWLALARVYVEALPPKGRSSPR